MNTLYARVFIQILDSSIAEDWRVRHVFEDILKLCNNGVLDMTREAFVRRTNTPRDEVDRALEILESPDPSSRDPEHEGRRLLRLDAHRDWGWRVANWEKYDTIRSAEDARMKTADRVRRHREQKAQEQPSASEAKRPTTLPKGFPANEAEAITHGEFAGIPRDVCLAAYHDANSRGGCDKHGRPITNFRSYAAKFHAYAIDRKNTPAGPAMKLLPGQQLRLWQDRIEIIRGKLTTLPAGEERSALIAEKKQLEAQIEGLAK